MITYYTMDLYIGRLQDLKVATWVTLNSRREFTEISLTLETQEASQLCGYWKGQWLFLRTHACPRSHRHVSYEEEWIQGMIMEKIRNNIAVCHVSSNEGEPVPLVYDLEFCRAKTVCNWRIRIYKLGHQAKIKFSLSGLCKYFRTEENRLDWNLSAGISSREW